MKPQSTLSTLISSAAAAALATAVGFSAVGAQAQTAPDPAPAPTAAPAAPPPAVPPAVEPAPAPAPALSPATEPAPAPEPMLTAEPVPEPAVAPAAAEEPVAEEDASAKPISVGAWGRIGTRLQGPNEPKELKHFGMDETTLELHFDGNATHEIGLTGNVIAGLDDANGDGLIDTQNGSVRLLDLIARFDIDDAFHVWGGRMLVPSDRANFSGSWFAAPWYYPGTFEFTAGGNGQFIGPQSQGPNGRNDGLTIWGQAEGGLFKYYASAFTLWDPTSKPWWTGRLNLSLISPEPGYYHSSTYYGGKDLLAIGIAGAFKKDGGSFTPMTGPQAGVTLIDDASTFNADVLFEKNLQEGGVLDLEGAFYLYPGDYEVFKHSYLFVASWMTADKVGPGKIQPLVRFQQAKVRGREPGSDDSTDTSLEVQIGYPIAEYGARLALGYQYTKFGATDVKGNAIFLGAQILK
jgi:hypothetical protein